MSTAAAILDGCCPPLVGSLVEELLTICRLTPDEAREVVAIVRAWGDEPANHRPQADLRAEIRGRILAYLQASRAPYQCHSCGTGIQSVFFVDANDREICRSCFDKSRPPVKCEHCPDVVTAEDSLPTSTGGRAHAACRAKLTNAYGYQASARMSALGIDVLKGGRS